MNDLQKARVEMNAFLLEVPKMKRLFQQENELELAQIRKNLALIFGFNKGESNQFVRGLEKDGKLQKVIRYPGLIYYKKRDDQ